MLPNKKDQPWFARVAEPGQKGVTLVEVLAAITILAFTVGVGFMLFSSVNSLWSNSVQKQSDDSNVNLALNTITRELSEPVEVLVLPDELRFKTYSGEYKRLTFNASQKLLQLEKATGASDIYSGSYTLLHKLADNAAGFSVEDASEVPIPGSSPNNYLSDGQLIRLIITFEYTRKGSNGADYTTNKEIEAAVKLFKVE